MDPRLLEQDEVEVELDIRGLNVAEPNAIENLVGIIDDELGKTRTVPAGLHSSFRTVGSEVSELQWKLASIVVSKGDIEELSRGHARLLHLYGRVVRLEPHSGGHKGLGRLKVEIGDRLTSFVNLLAAQLATTPPDVDSGNLNAETKQGDGTISKDGSDGKASGAWGGHHNLLSEDTTSKGAIPKVIDITSPSVHTKIVSKPLETLLRPLTSPTKIQLHFPSSVANPGRYDGQTLGSSSYVQFPQTTSHSTHNLGTHVPQPNYSDFQQRSSPQYLNVSQGWSMSKWPLRFSGGPKDLPIDEFIFRTETLARLSNLPQTALTLGLHQLLTGSASSWYWVFLRNQPNATWAQTRTSIICAFQSNESDAAIRRQIMDRLQRPGERYMEFQLAVQELEVRLATRMGEVELMETLRRNLLPHIQDRLLFVPIHSIYELQARVHQVEEHSQRQLEVQHLRRPTHRIHEITANPPLDNFTPNYTPISFPNLSYPPPPWCGADVRSNPFAAQIIPPESKLQWEENQANLCALGAVEDRNQFVVCWNCDEMGHTFIDCEAPRIIFCYGCGMKNFVRPQCPKCSFRAVQGNGRGSVRPTATSQAQPRLGGQQSSQLQLLRHQ